MLLLRATLLSTGTLLLTSIAHADPAPRGEPGRPRTSGLSPVASGVHVVDDTEPLAPLMPPGRDLLRGHILVGLAAGPSWSLGSLTSRIAAADGLGTGLGFRGDLGLGVSRSVAVGLWGELARYGDGDGCGDCAGSAFSVGPFVRYHLSQGLRFDPWLLAGAGFRSVSFDDNAGTQQTFSGVQWLRLELGADFYAWSGFGLGPYGSLSLTSYASQPKDSGTTRVNSELSAGLRLLFDLPGR